MPKFETDRFDTVPRSAGRVGAHRAHNPRINGLVALLWAALAAIVLTGAGIFAVMIMMGKVAWFNAEETPEAIPTPTISGILDPTYPVIVLNGTADAALLETMQAELVELGWDAANISEGASTSTDYENTVIFYVDVEDELAAIGLADAIGNADVFQSDAYAIADAEKQALVIVIGLDRATE